MNAYLHACMHVWDKFIYRVYWKFAFKQGQTLSAVLCWNHHDQLHMKAHSRYGQLATIDPKAVAFSCVPK